MQTNSIFQIIKKTESKEKVLEKIKKYTIYPKDYLHIVSLNPEIIVIASEQKKFEKVVREAQIKLVDGIGVVWAARTLGIKIGERIAGVDVMKDLLTMANDLRLRVLLIGGRPNLALRLAQCYRELYPQANFKGIEGIENIAIPTQSEEKELFSIVSAYKPHFVFVSFGSPEQELWIDRHKDKFSKMVCIGVGGAFDYEAGRVERAPSFLRSIGLEWLFRLLVQPWRWRSQLRLLQFIWLVIKEKF